MRYDAVRLFLDGARLRMPDFDLTPANTPGVAEGQAMPVENAAAYALEEDDRV
jgi:hypothetical protein